MESTEQLEFEPEGHTYTLKPSGIRLPSVSAIIAPLTDFSRVPKVNLDFARARGVAVHRACELHDKGTLDEDDLDPQLVPYLDAWKSFCASHDPRHVAVEQPMWHDSMMYAGTPDRISWIGGKLTLLDVKATAALNPAVEVQLAGYGMMASRVLKQHITDRWSVRLLPDGKVEVVRHKNADNTFMACYNIFMWKRAKNA